MILSALAEVGDRIHGLRAGGDDYLTKPFALRIGVLLCVRRSASTMPRPSTRRGAAIENQNVVGGAGGEKQPIAAVIGMVNDVARLGQAAPDELRYSFIVFDQQNFHAGGRSTA